MKKNTMFLLAMSSTLITPALVLPIVADAAQTPFKDVSPNNAYYEIVHEMRDKGIINGYTDGTFKPNETITRKHVAALLNRAVQLPTTNKVTMVKDVSTKHANYQDILAVQRAGIFDLDNKGNFLPNKEVTRAEMAKALVIAFNLKGSSNAVVFSDVPKNHSNFNIISTLYANGVTTGDNGKFLPTKTLTRAHYAVFMYRAMNLDSTDSKELPHNEITSDRVSDYPTDKIQMVERSKNNRANAYEMMHVPGGYENRFKYQEQQLAKSRELGAQIVSKSTKYFNPFMMAEQQLNRRLEVFSKETGSSVSELIQIINYVEATGEFYVGDTFFVYMNYKDATVTYDFK